MPVLIDFNEKAHRGRQMLSYGSKSRTATDSGYFSRFERVFHGEDDSNPQQRYLQEKMNYRKQCIGRPFYFTLPKQIPPPAFYSRFQPASRKMAENILRPPFRYPNPPKKGTGSGYGVVTIGKYPSAVTVQKEETKVHKTEAQSSDLPFYPPKSGKYFDGNPYREYKKSKTGLSTSPKKHIGYIRPWLNPGKGKKLGYMKDGCFTPFSHFGNQDLQRPVEDKRSPIGLEVTPNFICSIAPKSTATPSIIQKKIKRSVNAVTYKTITFI